MGFVVSILHFSVPQMYNGTIHQVRLLQDIGLELYVLCWSSFVLHDTSLYWSTGEISVGAYDLFLHPNLSFNQCIYVWQWSDMAHLGGQYFADRLLFLLFIMLFDRVVELMQAIYNSSITDGLTRLYNRKFFYNRVSQYVGDIFLFIFCSAILTISRN